MALLLRRSRLTLVGEWGTEGASEGERCRGELEAGAAPSVLQLARPPTGRTALCGCVFHLENRALNLDKCFFCSKNGFQMQTCGNAEVADRHQRKYLTNCLCRRLSLILQM